MMRKQIIDRSSKKPTSGDHVWLDLERLARVEITSEETGHPVESALTTGGVTRGGQVPIYYRVLKKENEWKVYDVVIEGVSLVGNYRTQFREILGNNPPEKLLETLRKKVGKG